MLAEPKKEKKISLNQEHDDEEKDWLTRVCSIQKVSTRETDNGGK